MNWIANWLPVFTRPETVNFVLDSWRYLQREEGFLLFGYVILENHLHLIARSDNLANSMKRFKSFTARQIVDHLKARGAEMLLKQMQAQMERHKTESDYQVWQEGSHPEQIYSEEMMVQKLDYIHRNPVVRGYVDEPIHWRYSSARNYEKQPGLIDVITDWK